MTPRAGGGVAGGGTEGETRGVRICPIHFRELKKTEEEEKEKEEEEEAGGWREVRTR